MHRNKEVGSVEPEKTPVMSELRVLHSWQLSGLILWPTGVCGILILQGFHLIHLSTWIQIALVVSIVVPVVSVIVAWRKRA